MRCYKLVFSKKGEINNYGSYIMITLTIIVLFCLILYCFKGPRSMKDQIYRILKYKKNQINNKNNLPKTHIIQNSKKKK